VLVSPAQPPPSVDGRVDEHLAHVWLRAVAPGYCLPVPPGTLKSHLQQILGIRLVLPGQQQRKLKQVSGPAPHELLEGVLCITAHRRASTIPARTSLRRYGSGKKLSPDAKMWMRRVRA
jgi:hypothetical protein